MRTVFPPARVTERPTTRPPATHLFSTSGKEAGDAVVLSARGDTRTGTGTLCRRWRAASLLAGWTVPGDWWVPAVEAVAEAVSDGRDPAPACGRLGRARADAGVGLDEAFADLAALHSVLGPGGAGGLPHAGPARGAEARPQGPDPLPAGPFTALALGWAEVACAPGASAGCDDPLTGLATAEYLRSRLGEVYREAERRGLPAGSDSALVVTDPGPGGAPPVGVPVELARIGRELTTAESVRAVFSGGETLCGAPAGRVIALVSRGPELPPRLAVLRRLLADRLAAPVRPARVWVEGLPPTLDAARRLVDELGR
jgi:hypothetical protein